jgi:hypothetical protein
VRLGEIVERRSLSLPLESREPIGFAGRGDLGLDGVVGNAVNPR